MGVSKFTQELFDSICEEIATTEKGLASICKPKGVSTVTFYSWIGNDATLLNTYARAREAQADYMAEQIIEIADDGSNDYMKVVKGDVEYNVENREVTARSKLRVDARKWIAAKLLPKKYGDKIDVTTGGEKITGWSEFKLEKPA